MSLPFTPERGRTSVLSLRLSQPERLALDIVARQEGIRSRTGEPNQSGAVYLGLAYAFRYLPIGWRPDNHLVLPGETELATHLFGPNVFDVLVHHAYDQATAEKVISKHFPAGQRLTCGEA